MSTPMFSILTPICEPLARAFQQTIDSVCSQAFSDWEWILVDQSSAADSMHAMLRRAARLDPRIAVIHRTERAPMVTPPNTGIESATGEFVVLVGQVDLLTIDALEHVKAVADKFSDVDYIYSDEDKSTSTALSGVFRKAD